MSSQAELDIRWPIGLLFLALGALLAIYGAVAPQITHWGNNELNLNLVWGVVMVLFGAYMTWGAHRASRRVEIEPARKEETAHHRG